MASPASSLVLYRCRGCRHQLFTSADTGALESPSCCRSAGLLRGLPEERLPGWVEQQLQEADWTRGRLLCPAAGCGAKLGTFDFVSGATCDCRATMLPAVRLVCSRLDELPTVLGGRVGVEQSAQSPAQRAASTPAARDQDQSAVLT